MPYMIAVSLEMSDEPQFLFSFIIVHTLFFGCKSRNHMLHLHFIIISKQTQPFSNQMITKTTSLFLHSFNNTAKCKETGSRRHCHLTIGNRSMEEIHSLLFPQFILRFQLSQRYDNVHTSRGKITQNRRKIVNLSFFSISYISPQYTEYQNSAFVYYFTPTSNQQRKMFLIKATNTSLYLPTTSMLVF